MDYEHKQNDIKYAVVSLCVGVFILTVILFAAYFSGFFYSPKAKVRKFERIDVCLGEYMTPTEKRRNKVFADARNACFPIGAEDVPASLTDVSSKTVSFGFVISPDKLSKPGLMNIIHNGELNEMEYDHIYLKEGDYPTIDFPYYYSTLQPYYIVSGKCITALIEYAASSLKITAKDFIKKYKIFEVYRKKQHKIVFILVKDDDFVNGRYENVTKKKEQK